VGLKRSEKGCNLWRTWVCPKRP